MKRFLISAGALTALAITSAPANAQSVTATEQANAHARIFRPLTITSVRDLDLGTIVLSGAGPYTDTVSIDQAGSFNCGLNLTCSGTPVTAQYEVTGTNNRNVTISVSPTIDLANLSDATAADLVLTVDSPAVVNIGATGNAGYTFDIGGSIQVSDTTPEGVYEGVFDVSAEYE